MVVFNIFRLIAEKNGDYDKADRYHKKFNETIIKLTIISKLFKLNSASEVKEKGNQRLTDNHEKKTINTTEFINNVGDKVAKRVLLHMQSQQPNCNDDKQPSETSCKRKTSSKKAS
jgi:hypothetical protein